jgi:carbamoyltransferase
MPFAPSVLEEDLANWFVTLNHTLQPFEYMTMTCDVRADKRNLVPAITHVDGTARPQIVSNTSNKFLYQILNEFKIQTGIPILVNTSLNIDEEPIIRNLDSALNALERGAIDDLFTNNAHYTFD